MSEKRVTITLIGGPLCGQAFCGLESHNCIRIEEIDLLSGEHNVHVYQLKEKTASNSDDHRPIHKFQYDPERSRNLK